MYLALFVMPWVLMYAISTFVMNHRDFFRGRPAQPPKWEKVSEQTYQGEFAQEAKPREISTQLLASLGLEGMHNVNKRGENIVVMRQDALSPKRITLSPDKKVVVEKMVWDTSGILEHMHRRRGYQQPYLTDNIWAVSVDLFNTAVVFWILSGLWMWWEMKVTRGYGTLCFLGGVGLFVIFLEVL